MNEVLTKLAIEAKVEHCISHVRLQAFADLIVQECINKILNSNDEHFMKLEDWDIGSPNHHAWTRGVLDSVAVVREHFGVEQCN